MNTESRNTEQESKAELLARLDVMEAMMQEGRRSTVRWGWIFVLWGAAYLIAIGWSSFLPSWVPWTVTMVGTAIICSVIVTIKRRGKPTTQLARSVSAIWNGVGIALFVYSFGISISGHVELHSFWATVEVLFGTINFASAMILRWRVQFLIATLWFSSALATCFVSTQHVLPILIADTVLGMIGFGLYLMYLEHRDRRTSTTAVQHG
ncbi:MAG TPA: hypothetical protein VMU62_08885 [Acidobacteriaceae bacterium]|nr:hypothetical protein [Acidobacteriaceae bacterium]